MEQQRSPPATAQRADCVIVNLELQVVVASNAAVAAASNGSDNYHVVDVKARRPTAGVQQDHHVVTWIVWPSVSYVVADGDAETSPKGNPVEVRPKGVDNGAGSKNQCVVCAESMRSVAIGRCGHRGVCSKCMVHGRFFQQNRRCYICNIQCPKVLVAKADDGVCDRAATPPKLPRFTFRDGCVGNYWYPGHTAAYFEEDKEHQAARAECEGIIPRFYQPLVPRSPRAPASTRQRRVAAQIPSPNPLFSAPPLLQSVPLRHSSQCLQPVRVTEASRSQVVSGLYTRWVGQQRRKSYEATALKFVLTRL
ncbi:LOW QUALITY PROTEIN: hypothetical protein SETIT_8G122700v2 [Setaria italica]|uniref:RING-type domain-containing protein n=1 Tax=Setaria italica TaxID=4555 RepID=A0A368S774_SETIT|nr:LOW QUALITY PROTEIN: hypothetical protein SETIT_8G122700v2 [Setaria italica]